MNVTTFDQGTLEGLRTFNQGREEAEKFELSRRALEPLRQFGVGPYRWEEVRGAVDWLVERRLEELGRRTTLEAQEQLSLADTRTQIRHALRKFTAMPFTIQRLAEILLEPDRSYRSALKMAYALEKLLRVSGTLPDLTPEQYAAHVQELEEKVKKLGETDNDGPMMMAIDVDLRPAPAVMMGLLAGGGGGGGGLGGDDQDANLMLSMESSLGNENSPETMDVSD